MRWVFYHYQSDEWQWDYHNNHTLPFAEWKHPFKTLEECVADAKRHGFTDKHAASGARSFWRFASLD